jgi:hypothetical protein
LTQGTPFADAWLGPGGADSEESMTDGTISTIVSLVVGMLATSVSAVVVSRTRDRERRRVAEHEAVAVRDARLRAELHLLEVQAGELRSQVAELESRRADLLAAVQAAAAGRDPAAAVAEGALRRAHAHPHSELSRRLERAGDAHVIPFPFLAGDDDATDGDAGGARPDPRDDG